MTTTEITPPAGEAAPVVDENANVEGAAIEDQPVAETDSGGGKFRDRLSQAEAERDALRERVDRMQRGEVERLVANRLADPGDVWRDGAQLADLLDDDGHVDPAKVDTLAAGLLDAHKHWATTSAPPRRNPASGGSGLKSGASSGEDYRRPSFTDAFAPAKRD